MYRTLHEDASQLADEVVSFASELIRTPSLRLHEEQVASKVRDRMRDLDFDLVFTDDAGNVVGVVAGGDPRLTVMLHTHMDTADLGPLAEWSHPPLAADLADDRLYGLGAAECKGAIASQVFAGHLLARRLVQPRVNLVVVAAVAGESGCSVGSRHLVRKTLPRIGLEPMLCILGEPTGLDVCIGHDGWVRIDLDVRTPDLKMAECVAEIVHQELGQHCDTGSEARRPVVMTAGAPRTEKAEEGCRCRVQVMRRLFFGETVESILNCLRRHLSSELRGLPDLNVDVHVREEDQELYTGRRAKVTCLSVPWSTNLAQPLVDSVRTSLVSAGLPWSPRPWSRRLGLGTAGGMLTADLGVPVICFGPGNEDEINTPDESVPVFELVDAVYGLAAVGYGLSQTAHLEDEGP